MEYCNSQYSGKKKKTKTQMIEHYLCYWKKQLWRKETEDTFSLNYWKFCRAVRQIIRLSLYVGVRKNFLTVSFLLPQDQSFSLLLRSENNFCLFCWPAWFIHPSTLFSQNAHFLKGIVTKKFALVLCTGTEVEWILGRANISKVDYRIWVPSLLFCYWELCI